MSIQAIDIDEQLAIRDAERESLITKVQELETRKLILEMEMKRCQVESQQLEIIDKDLETIIRKVYLFSVVDDGLISGNRNPHEVIRQSLQALHDTCIPQTQEEIINNMRALEIELEDISVHLYEAYEKLLQNDEIYGVLY